MAERKIYKLDADGKAVGRLATEIANLLRGKNTPEFEMHIDNGGVVQVSNIKKLKFSGKKLEQKEYYSYSGYPGGLKTKKMSDLEKSNPAEILMRAVREMIPPTRLRNDMLKRLIIK